MQDYIWVENNDESNFKENQKARSDDTKAKVYCVDFAKKETEKDREETQDREDFVEDSEEGQLETPVWLPSKTSILRRFRCFYECTEHLKNIGT